MAVAAVPPQGGSPTPLPAPGPQGLTALETGGTAESRLVPNAGAEAAVPSFAEDMWERLDFLWQHRVEPTQRALEQIVHIMRSRAELERRYGESLMTLSNSLQIAGLEGTVFSAVDAALVNFKNRGEQSIALADEIEQDVVCTFEAVLWQHREVCKLLQRDAGALARYCQERQHAHDKLARRYGSRCSDAERVAQECLQGLAMKQPERMKLAVQATTLSRQARAAEHEYYLSIEQVNKARALYHHHMPLVLGALQDMDEKRSRCIRDGLRKLSVYEASWLRNLQYDLEGIVKAAEGADPVADLQAFIRGSGEPSRRPLLAAVSPQPFWMLARAKEPPAPGPAARRQLEVQGFIRQLIDTELQPIMRKLLGEEPPAADEVRDIFEQLRQGSGDPRRRAALCQVLRAEVLRDEPAGTEIDNCSGILLAPAVFEGIVMLFKALLDACDEQSDAWSGRDLMVLTQLMRTQGEGNRAVPLISRVYTHPLWNKVTFWEDVLMIGLCEAHSAEAVWRRSLVAGSQFTQPSMTAFLQRFVGYMMAFGISLDQGRVSVSATLRKHAQVLGSASSVYGILLLQPYDKDGSQTTSCTPSPARTLEESADPRGATNGYASSLKADGSYTDGFHVDSSPADGSPADGVGAAWSCDRDDMGPGGLPLNAQNEDDDFEALAFGITLPTPTAAPDSEDKCQTPTVVDSKLGSGGVASVPGADPVDPAFEALAQGQLSASDVFA